MRRRTLDEAERHLAYYLRIAWEAAGFTWTTANEEDVSIIVGAIRDHVHAEIDQQKNA